MTTASIIGIGQTDVKEHWETSIRHLAWYAIEAALDDAHITKVDALYVGNMLAGQLSHQMHLGALVADFAGMRGIEAVTVEAADASGGAALRQAVLAVKSGLVETALVVGVEKMTDETGAPVTAALASGLDADYEVMQGLTTAGMGALLMRRYMHEYGVEVSDFAGFSVNAHANGADNPLAMFRNRLKPERFATAPQVATPVSLFDAAPTGDGAAAVIVTRTEQALDMVPQPVLVAGSALATDTVALHDRHNPLWLRAAEKSARKAARDGEIGRDGRIPISTFGGLKARGNPAGATGVYQIVEVVRQLRGEAGANQIPDAKIGMSQNVGGSGATAVTHVLKKAAL